VTHTSYIVQRVKDAERAVLSASFPDSIEIYTDWSIFRCRFTDKKINC